MISTRQLKKKKITNYAIRETENVREIKVLVETDDLESQIPTDF